MCWKTAIQNTKPRIQSRSRCSF